MIIFTIYAYGHKILISFGLFIFQYTYTNVSLNHNFMRYLTFGFTLLKKYRFEYMICTNLSSLRWHNLIMLQSYFSVKRNFSTTNIWNDQVAYWHRVCNLSTTQKGSYSLAVITVWWAKFLANLALQVFIN